MTEEKQEKTEEKKPAQKKPAKKVMPVKKQDEPKPGVSQEKKPEVVHEHKPVEHVHAAEVKAVETKVVEAKAVDTTKAVPEEKKRAKKKHAEKKEQRVFVVRGKRKESVASATIKKGRGVIRLNKINVEALNNRYLRDLVKEPLRFLGPEANAVDISVTVCGGGTVGQIQAARTAIANALVVYFDDSSLKDRMFAYDKFLIVEDSRRVEPKKYKGPKARARFQKSYR